ncbi:GNS1/SUR4 family protein [Cavenderia fasciculata]|uniref:Elongation of fatty acids protein n=1 Tax=Cavenderia fasciculata TaxID=261658 RepID=F4Q0Y2_CACFS|nr:GNS1/SUR4 family protein [Cavenderia fasciculata]EGG18483.1 GNS1/SUR4 family protein [Cavenderia fasciculata]|eukprot:XP_004366387.1 GNS1/SUR4 family protein [Cavenderia fasciculata]
MDIISQLFPLEYYKSLLPLEYNSFESFVKVDFSKWDWSQLIPSENFKYEEGVTPFSNKNFIFMAIISYLLTVYTIKAAMSNSKLKGFSLGYVSAIHNLILCGWSLVMVLGVAYDAYLIATTTSHGINCIFCSPKSNPFSGRIFYWHYLYFISKFYEFLDTIIIVLKKKPLIFLHIWHHSIVVLIVWTWLPEGIAYGNVGLFANTLVHVFMYYYYFRTSLNPSIRIWWKSYLTSGQLFQFTMSFILAIPFLVQDISYDKETGIVGHSCVGWGGFSFTMMNNLFFLILFMNFYIKTYLTGGANKKGNTRGNTIRSSSSPSTSNKKVQ